MRIKHFNLLRRRRDVRQTKSAICALRKNHDFLSDSSSDLAAVTRLGHGLGL